MHCIFPTKKQILYIKSFRTNNFWIRRHKTINREKAKNIFRSRFFRNFIDLKENNHKLLYFFLNVHK